MKKKKRTPVTKWFDHIKKSNMNPASVLKFYWKMNLICGLSMCALNFFLVVLCNNKYEAWKNVPVFVWVTSISILFFETLNLCYLKTTPGYCALAEKIRAEGKGKEFQSIYTMSWMLLLFNVVLIILDTSKFIPILGAVALGWFLTGIIQACRNPEA